MFSVNNISVQFSGVNVLQDVSLIINKKDRIGLVGKNGAGKTTLLRILAGQQALDAGSISLPSGCSVGFLPQEVKFSGTQSVFVETLHAFKRINELKKTIERCTQNLEQITEHHSDEYAEWVSLLNISNEQFAILGGYNIEAETEKILLGLGFTIDELHIAVSSFSGGWRMRIELAKILLQKHDLLLLDEPTNHLDIESIQWLEDYLIKYQGAVLLVSHDRTLLDNVTKRTVEINFGHVYDYNVPYSEYVLKRDERISQQKAEYQNQQKYIEQTEKFIERFRYKATKSKQVQSRVKMLDKLERIEVDALDNSSIFFKFPPAPASGKIVVEAEKLNKKYGQKEVLHNLDFIIDKGDKIAFVGKNGEGKTTLSRIIVGDLPHEGMCKLGFNVSLGYYAQNETELLNSEKTVFETIDDVAVGDIRPKIRNILGAFLFGGDTIEKKVKVLSGGEKSRLALARLLLKPVNLLVLDEPTNHLDMKAKDILKKALMNYDGTLIIVSHDRYFLQGLTQKVFEFKNTQIRQYIGDVNDFLKSRRLETLKDLEKQQSLIKDKAQQQSGLSQNKMVWEKKKEIEKQIRKVQNHIKKTEEEIGTIEERQKEIEKLLDKPETIADSKSYDTLYSEYNTQDVRQKELLDIWASQHEALEVLQKQLGIF